MVYRYLSRNIYNAPSHLFTQKMSNQAAADEDAGDDHLDDVPDGAGCTEIWERLSERRNAD